MNVHMIIAAKYLNLFALSLGLMCSISNAQTFKMGFKMGMPGLSPLKAVLESGVSFPHSNYTLGPQLEVRLPAGFAIELDALYTGAPYNQVGDSVSANKASASNWEFPVLVKARFGKHEGRRSFVGAGPSFRTIWGIRDAILGRKAPVGSLGFSIASGSEFRLGPLTLCPEVRYTRWGATTFGNGLELILGNRANQAQFLIGVVF